MINRVQLIGRTGQDPEVRHLENGMAVANFTLATNEKFKTKDGEKKEITDWHKITIWGNLAEVVEKYVKKGDLLYIEGKIRTRSWDNKEGKTQYTTEIIGNVMQMLGGKSEGRPEIPPPSEENVPENLGQEDDLPF